MTCDTSPGGPRSPGAPGGPGSPGPPFSPLLPLPPSRPGKPGIKIGYLSHRIIDSFPRILNLKNLRLKLVFII